MRNDPRSGSLRMACPTRGQVRECELFGAVFGFSGSYAIISLPSIDYVVEAFGLDADTLKAASDSWKRTMDIVGPGLQDCQNWLAQAREQKLNPTPEETN